MRLFGCKRDFVQFSERQKLAYDDGAAAYQAAARKWTNNIGQKSAAQTLRNAAVRHTGANR